MLNQGNVLVIILFFLISCQNRSVINERKAERINDVMKLHSKVNIDLFNTIIDTLLVWKKDSLLNSKLYMFDDTLIIDKKIVINSDSTRLFTYLFNIDFKNKGSNHDGLMDLAGAKISGKWYFFFGTYTVIDRAFYQDSIYSPMTFDELSYLARENLSSAFYQDKNGKVKVRESFFDFMDDSNGWGLPPGSTRKDIDSVIVARNKEMRQYKIDPAEIEQIKAEMAKSVRPQEPISDLKWYEKIFPKEKKLFETDEWKEYVKSKNRGK